MAMVLIEAHWMILVMTVLLSALYTWMWFRERKNYLTSLAREAELYSMALLKDHKVVEDLHKDFNYELMTANKRFQEIVNGQTDKFNHILKVRNSLTKALIPETLRIAQLRPDTEEGNTAARILYMLNCLGLFTPTKHDCKIIARGQVLAGRNPAELQDLLKELEEKGNEAPTEEGTPLVSVGQGTSETQLQEADA